MLAQNFKTPADLGIADVEFESLVKVLGMLDRGELVYGRYPLSVEYRRPNEFNMAVTLQEMTCGAIGCLCGWAHVVSDGVAFAEVVNRTCLNETAMIAAMPIGLRKLFRFGASVDSLYKIEPEQAAIALRNYLTSGEPRWAEALNVDD